VPIEDPMNEHQKRDARNEKTTQGDCDIPFNFSGLQKNKLKWKLVLANLKERINGQQSWNTLQVLFTFYIVLTIDCAHTQTKQKKKKN